MESELDGIEREELDCNQTLQVRLQLACVVSNECPNRKTSPEKIERSLNSLHRKNTLGVEKSYLKNWSEIKEGLTLLLPDL